MFTFNRHIIRRKLIGRKLLSCADPPVWRLLEKRVALWIARLITWRVIAHFALFSALFSAQFSAQAQPSLAQPALSGATPPTRAVAIHIVEDRSDTQGEERGIGVVIDITARPQFRYEVMSEPSRVVIDLENTILTSPTSGGKNGQGAGKAVGFISGYRAGLFMAGQSRIVLDLVRPALVERADFVRQDGIERLVFLLRPVTEDKFASQVEADAKKRAEARAVTSPSSATPPKPATKNSRPIVVLDPGHGGLDSGATGAKGEMEKDIVLAFAKAIRVKLEASGRVDVVMTREDDRFIPLAGRVAFAQERQAQLFVSLHADSLSGEADVRGASVYTLSESASDAAAARAAEKENRSDQLAGLDRQENKPEGVDTILFDLARRETRIYSHLLARETLSALHHVAQLHKTPQRAAGFHVLKAGDIPSILIELGYLSNSKDIAFLTNPAAQTRMAEALAEAIVKFVQVAKPAQ